ncbi:Rpn family recombination-promoting nuclease/putative transposase [Bacillus sp. FSL W7-1360]
MSRQHPPHDQLFRQLLDNFFTEFMQAFFPEEAACLNLNPLEHMTTEVYFEGDHTPRLRPDFVVKIKLKGEDTMVLVHIEVQATYDEAFLRRMRRYHARLMEHEEYQVLPLAVFSYETPHKEPPKEMTHHLNGKTDFSFSYRSIFLRQLSWQDFSEMKNPAVCALLSKMGYNVEEKVACKKAFLRLITKLELTEMKRHFIMQFFDFYLTLTDEEEKQLAKEINRLKPEEGFVIADFMTSYERLGWKKGIEEGIEKGRMKGIEEERTETAIRMLREGVEVIFIAKVTQLSVEKVRELQVHMKEL